MVFDRLARTMPVLATALALAGCVTIGPVASPTDTPTAAPSASPAPTATATAAPTLPPTAPPTAPPTVPPTEAPTEPPTEPPTAPPTEGPTSPPTDTELDPYQPALYGLDDDLNSGFPGDPMAVSVISGGSIDVSNLGGQCVGYAGQSPDVQVHYIAGAQALLRFYFVADTPGDDAVLIINDTAGRWHCNDDYSASTRDPSIEFSPPADGYYDIWIGSFTAGEFIAGTLYITELSFNHP